MRLTVRLIQGMALYALTPGISVDSAEQVAAMRRCTTKIHHSPKRQSYVMAMLDQGDTRRGRTRQRVERAALLRRGTGRMTFLSMTSTVKVQMTNAMSGLRLWDRSGRLGAADRAIAG